MIAPDIRIVDGDPEGFGVICEVARAALWRTRNELHVLHRDGQVVRAIHTANGRVDLGDASLDAAALRRSHHVDRVILVDEAALTALAPSLAAVVSEPTQDRMLRASHDVFWASPGVVADPPPGADRWAPTRAWLNAQPDGSVLLGAMYDGDTCAATLVAVLEGGRIAMVTSLHVSPSRSNARALIVTANDAHGRVDATFIADIDVVGDLLATGDWAAAAVAAIVAEGVPS